MTRRPGMSLTEVLVALFIMALGTIAILTLFPLGAIQMGQALKDDRTAQAAMQADAFMRTYWKQNVVEPPAAAVEPFTGAFLDPVNANTSALFPTPNPQQPNLFPIPLPSTNHATNPNPSYPVVVDPMGFVARPTLGMLNQQWVGNLLSGGASLTNLPRRNLRSVAVNGQPIALALRTCSLMDGLGYMPNGTGNQTGGTLDRELRYNWLWVFQAPDSSNTTAANMTIVVFDKRASVFAPATAETVFSASGSPGSTTVSFPLGAAPPVQKGGWLLDATVMSIDYRGNVAVPPAGLPAPGAGAPSPPFGVAVRTANFYRVVSVTDNVTTDVELQTPLTDTVTPVWAIPGFGTVNPIVVVPPVTQRQFIFLAGVSEVFQRPQLP